MKIIKRNLEKDSSGDITLCPEDSEDMWHCYNLIQEGDEIEARSMRRITKISKDGSKGPSTRKLIKLELTVEKVDFDPETGSLRIKGPVIKDTEDVSAGTYHTFDLEVNRNFRLYKQVWDLIALETVQNASDPESKAEVGAIVMQEGEYAYIID